MLTHEFHFIANLALFYRNQNLPTCARKTSMLTRWLKTPWSPSPCPKPASPNVQLRTTWCSLLCKKDSATATASISSQIGTLDWKSRLEMLLSGPITTLRWSSKPISKNSEKRSTQWSDCAMREESLTLQHGQLNSQHLPSTHLNSI